MSFVVQTCVDVRAIGRREVARDVRALELPSDAVYLVHSSLRRVGVLEDGPRTLVDGLLDACGSCSTIVVPTFTAGNSTTTREYRRRTAGMSEQQLLAEEAKIPGFHRETTPSQNVGIVAEYIRGEAGSARSYHPQTSFSAVGPFADQLVLIHDLECHLGEKSPMSWLYDINAVVLLIGVGFEVCTCFHLAEYRLDKPAPSRLYRTFVVTDEQRELREFFAPETDDSDFGRIGAEMARQPFVNVGRIGDAPVTWFRLRAGVDFAVDWMNRCR
jgi:aminoglycoside 3-N-acetyltransferase